MRQGCRNNGGRPVSDVRLNQSRRAELIGALVCLYEGDIDGWHPSLGRVAGVLGWDVNEALDVAWQCRMDGVRLRFEGDRLTCRLANWKRFRDERDNGPFPWWENFGWVTQATFGKPKAGESSSDF